MLPLPDMEQGSYLTGYIYAQTTAPDGQWVVFYVATSNHLSYFVYNIATQNLHELGQFEAAGLQYFNWLNNETIVIFDYNSVLRDDTVYIAKVTQPNSLLFTGYTIEVNPLSIIWDEQIQRDNGAWDVVYEYDLATHQRNQLFEFQCGTALVECGSGTVVRSHDGRYVAGGIRFGGAPHYTIWIYDLEQEQLIFESHESLIDDLAWTPENILLMLDEEGIKQFNLNTLDITPIIEIPRTDIGSLWMSPNREAVIFRQDNNYQIYHARTDQIYSVVQDEYSLFAQWADNGDVLAEVRNRDCMEFPCFGGSWHVRIDALDEDNS
jgi:hypothetical protein